MLVYTATSLTGLSVEFELLATGFAAAAAPFRARAVFILPALGRRATRKANTARAFPKALRLTRRSHKPPYTMAESIPKAKSAYAFFQAAMNKQMVGVPLG